MSDLVARLLFSVVLTVLWPFFRTRWFAFASFANSSTTETERKSFGVACRIAQAGEAAMGFAWGSTSIGPPHVFPWGSPGSMALGVCAATLMIVSSQVHLRRTLRELTQSDSQTNPPAVSALTYGLGALGLLAAIMFGALPFLLGNISEERVRASSPTTADLATLINPMDAEAWLARGWNARRMDALISAGTFIARAESLGVSRQLALELRAELYAAEGNCEQAEAAFVESLREQAQRTVSVDAPLDLASYRLPPTLVERCDLLADP